MATNLLNATPARKVRSEISALVKAKESLLAKFSEAGVYGADEKAQIAQADEEVRAKTGLLEALEGLNVEQTKLGLKVDPNTLAETEAERSREGQAEEFRSYGEFLQAVARAEGGERDPRLVYRAASGMNEASGVEGGFLVQTDQAVDLFGKAYGMGQIASRTKKIRLTSGANAVKLTVLDDPSRVKGSRYGGVQVYWLGETGTATATKPKLRQMELSLKKLVGLTYSTEELLADAGALEAVTGQAMAEEMQFEIEDTTLNGVGGGQPLGILNSGALVTVSKESGQTADTINGYNLVNMWARLWPRSLGNAVWLYNQAAAGQLAQATIPGGGNFPAFQFPGQMGNAPGIGSILGLPAFPCEQCSALGDVGDILLVDLSQYLHCDKAGVAQSSSIHVRFVEGETAFRWMYRIDGQPLWRQALTPAKGSATLSPYIALEAR